MNISDIRNFRWGTWNGPHAQVGTAAPLEWKKTPRSKQFQCLKQAVVVPGTLLSASQDKIEFRVDETVHDALRNWYGSYEGLFPPRVGEGDVLTCHGGYYILDKNFTVTKKPIKTGTNCLMRVYASAQKMCGDVHKITLHPLAVKPT